MSGDLPALVGEAWPYVMSAVGAYGAAVLSRAQDEAADATVGWGRKILQRVFGVVSAEDEVPEAVIDLVESPADSDVQAALRMLIRKALAADPGLAAEIRAMVAEAASVVAPSAGDHGVAVGRDMNITATTHGVAAAVIHGSVSSANPPQPGSASA